MSTEKQPWAVIAHSYQIADTGDYDGHYEITNGKISLFTNDESDDSDETEDKPYQKVADALNATNSKFWIDDSWMVELSHSRQSAEELRTALAAKDKEIEQWKLRAEMLLRTREPEQATIDWATDKVIELKNAEIERLKGVIRTAIEHGKQSAEIDTVDALYSRLKHLYNL